MKFKRIRNKEFLLELCFYLFVFLMILGFIFLQPFGEGPDESNRYKVTEYIRVHGELPHGADPDLHIHGYGASYAFQPILSYIIQGYFNRFVSIFTTDSQVLLFFARLVNAITGVIMAVFVRKTSKLIFDRPLMAWAFTMGICLLPQNLFIHSYVNTDSTAALATSIIIYAIIKGYLDYFQMGTCITLSIGIALCALSYYNAYGIIICAILLFFLRFFSRENGKLVFHFRDFIKKGLYISLLVLSSISWWFIRNYLLYDGDILGMTARKINAIETSTPEYSPLTKFTYYNEGYSFFEMASTENFRMLLTNSFIGLFGPMNVYMQVTIYRIFKTIFLIGAISYFLPVKENTILSKFSKLRKLHFNLAMLLNVAIVTFLCMYYNYTWDYQPQGRYLLPMLISIMYFVYAGWEKLFVFLHERMPAKIWKGVFTLNNVRKLIVGCILVFFCYALIHNLITVLIPYYKDSDNIFRSFFLS